MYVCNYNFFFAPANLSFIMESGEGIGQELEK